MGTKVESISIARLRELAATPCACNDEPDENLLALVEAVEAAQRWRSVRDRADAIRAFADTPLRHFIAIGAEDAAATAVGDALARFDFGRES